MEFSKDQRRALLSIARNAILGELGMPVGARFIAPIPNEKRAVFVTLTKNGDLRGCIGHLSPILPLEEAVEENAKNAAFSDPRFFPVSEDELEDIEIEISVLSLPQKISGHEEILPSVHGVILRKNGYSSTFLPQVWEELPDKTEFLEHLSLKAGLPANAWQSAELEVYTGEHFSEGDT